MKTTIAGLGSFFLSLSLVACSNDSRVGRGSVPDDNNDLTYSFDDIDGGPSEEAGPPGPPTVCGDNDPQCMDVGWGPQKMKPFPLSGDQNKNPDESDQGVNKDPNGFLVLDSTHGAFNYLWIANTNENTTSKIDSKTLREVARYSTVTCYSFPPPVGSKQACDGTKGCCAFDDYPRWQARKAKQQPPPHEGVQLSSNYPSRTAIDFNGDLFISNRAFGGQPSVTRIANDLADCVDRNHNGKIDTSSDVNKDGVIEVNDPNEYLGLDDECILWTTNSLQNNGIGRPLGLSEGVNDATNSDAWAGSFQYGNFVRIDGKTGTIKDEAQLPQPCHSGTGPYGLAVDAQGVGWTPDLGGGKLCYFDTKNPQNVGVVRDPQWGPMQGYGITLDRDQNVWVGSGVARYTPDRSNGFNNLGNGWWTLIQGRNGMGIAADSRNNKEYFVWACNGGNVLRIPASTIPMVKMDQMINPGGWPTISMNCYGVGVDADQNIWGVPQSNVVTRAIVDMNGNITAPQPGAPMGNNRCPAGDTCDLSTGHYTYSDFTGFGLRNFTRPTGTYSFVVKGCSDQQNGQPTATQWYAVSWDFAAPPNTTLSVRARSGNVDPPNNTWGQFTAPTTVSPIDLHAAGLMPNSMGNDGSPDAYLQVEFTFKTADRAATPRLKAFDVGFKCTTIQ